MTLLLIAARWLASWMSIRKAADEGLVRTERALMLCFGKGPAGVNTSQLEAALENRNAANAQSALQQGINRVAKALDEEMPRELLETLVAGAAAEAKTGTRVLASNFRDAAKSTFAIEQKFDVTNADAVKWAKANAAKMVVDLTTAQRKAVNEAVVWAFNQQKNRRELTTVLKGIVPLDSRRSNAALKVFEKKGMAAFKKEVTRLTAQRAKVIARTETMRASNEGQRQLWVQRIKKGDLPSNVMREWITTPDERLCEICAPLNGTKAPIDGQFPGGHFGPPAHPQCRCAQGLVSGAKTGKKIVVPATIVVPETSKIQKKPAKAVMDLVGLPNLSILPPQPVNPTDDPWWDVPSNVDKAEQAITQIYALEKKLQSAHFAIVQTPLAPSSATPEGRMKTAAIRTALSTLDKALDAMKASGFVDTEALNLDIELVDLADQSANLAFWEKGTGTTNKLKLNIASAAWRSETALRMAIKASKDAGLIAFDTPEGVIAHEIGHATNYWTPEGEALIKAAAGTWTNAGFKAVASNTSMYAATKPTEFVAETFAMLFEGKPVNPAAYVIYKQLGGYAPPAAFVAPKAAAITPPPPKPIAKVSAPPIPTGPEGEIIKKVLELRAQGLSYNAIEKAMGWPPQKGFKAFGIVKKYGATANADGEKPAAQPIKAEASAPKQPEIAPPTPTVPESLAAKLKKAIGGVFKSITDEQFEKAAEMIEAGESADDVALYAFHMMNGSDAFTKVKLAFKNKAGVDLDAVKKAPAAVAPPAKPVTPAPTKITKKAILDEFKLNGPTDFEMTGIEADKVLQEMAAGKSAISIATDVLGITAPQKQALFIQTMHTKFGYDPFLGKKPPIELPSIAMPPAAAAPALKAPTGQPSAAWVDQLLANKVSGQKGSNAGGTYQGPDGETYYVKFYATPAQGHGEKVTNTILKKLGLGAPDSITAVSSTGQQIYASKWMNNLTGTGKSSPSSITASAANRFMDGFLADVLTANWDAVGLELDNIGFLQGGEIARLDNGGSLLYRAQGKLKPAGGLQQIGEWQSLLNPGLNPKYSSIAGKAGINKAEDLGKPRLTEQLNKIKGLVNDWTKVNDWKSLLDDIGGPMSEADKVEIANMLHARVKLLNDKVATVGVPVAPPKATTFPTQSAPKNYDDNFEDDDDEDDFDDDDAVSLPPLPPSGKKNKTSYVSSANENKIKNWAKQGYSPAQISEATGITTATVKSTIDADAPGLTVTQPLPTSSAKAPAFNAPIGAAPPPEWVARIPSDSAGRRDMPRPDYATELEASRQRYNGYMQSLPSNQGNWIRRYTGSYYQTVNGALRGGRTVLGDSSSEGRNAATIQKALLAAPQPPPPTLVYRTQGLTPELEAALKPGVEVQMNGFQSSSVNPDLNFGGGKALFEIIPKRGGYVESISRFAREKEFLCPHGQKYRVLKVTNVGFGKVVYRVEML